MAKANPFRFSTKYQDDETDLLYFGYRYYNPGAGGWTSKDPLQESAGLNLYCYVNNSPINRQDKLGGITIHLNSEESDGKRVCGGFRYVFDYYLDNTHDEPGYIVQQI